MKEIILASTSPRRKMLLNQVHIPFKIIVPHTTEAFPENGDFADVVVANAEAKAKSVVGKADGKLILGADTIVDLNGVALGKPVNRDDARRMLNMLSGNEHNVYTGIALVDSINNRILSDYAKTKVKFRSLRTDEIENYIESGEPLDKAGSYGIQERGALFIESIHGCFFNVMGLPLSKLWELLRN